MESNPLADGIVVITSEKYGFMPLLDDELHLFLSIATLCGARRQS
jgi:hypothetical protein